MRAGTEIRVKTERPELAISLSEMAKGSWVVFELPGFANATSGKQQESIDALRKATETSYFKGPDAVWAKLVIPTAPRALAWISLARWILKPASRSADKQLFRERDKAPCASRGLFFARRMVGSKRRGVQAPFNSVQFQQRDQPGVLCLQAGRHVLIRR